MMPEQAGEMSISCRQ